MENTTIAIQDTGLERRFLAMCVEQYAIYAKALTMVTEECFTEPKNRQLYQAIKNLIADGQKMDVSLLGIYCARIDKELFPYYMKAVAEEGEGADPQTAITYASTLNDMTSRRALLSAVHKIARDVQDPTTPLETTLEQLRQSVDKATEQGSDNIVTLASVLPSLWDMIGDNLAGKQTGIATGFSGFDAMGGLRPADLVIIGADSSQGKTSFALSMIRNALLDGRKVACYSLEMSNLQLATRLLAQETKLNGRKIAMDKLTDEELNKTEVGFGAMEEYTRNLFVDDTPDMTFERMLTSIRRMHLTKRVELVVIDYLQILQVGNANQTDEHLMAHVARRLKNIAKELNVCVVGLSQLSRAGETSDPAPTIKRLRSSGQIAEAADIVALIYRPEYYGPDCRYKKPFADVETHGTALVDICKGRNTGTAQFIVGFDEATTQFYELDVIPKYADTPWIC